MCHHGIVVSPFSLFWFVKFRGITSFVCLPQTQQQDVGAFPKVVFGFLFPVLLQWDWETRFASQGSSSPTAGMRAAGGQSETECAVVVYKMTQSWKVFCLVYVALTRRLVKLLVNCWAHCWESVTVPCRLVSECLSVGVALSGDHENSLSSGVTAVLTVLQSHSLV